MYLNNFEGLKKDRILKMEKQWFREFAANVPNFRTNSNVVS